MKSVGSDASRLLAFHDSFYFMRFYIGKERLSIRGQSSLSRYLPLILYYVSKKLKSEEWGSKVISQLSEYIRSQHPEIKGYSRRNIYNMVMFYDEYSTETFTTIVNKYLDAEFVQPWLHKLK